MLRILISLACFTFLYSCKSGSPEKSEKPAAVQEATWEPPAAGTEVARYTERVKEDKLNEKYFRVIVKATPDSRSGNFLLRLEYGFNINETAIDLPAWTGNAVLKPVLQKGEGAYHCLLGFDAGDGQFRELYDIRVDNGDVRLKQTKGYYTPR